MPSSRDNSGDICSRSVTRYPVPDNAAGFEATLWWPGLWHMHGTLQSFGYPFSRLKEVMAECERLSRAAGKTRFVVRLTNQSDQWQQQPVTHPVTKRLVMADWI